MGRIYKFGSEIFVMKYIFEYGKNLTIVLFVLN